MSDEQPAIGGAIVPVEQRTIDFYGDELVAIRDGDGAVWVPVRHMCEALGIARQGQMERIKRDPVLGEALRGGSVTLPPGAGGGTQEMACLPLKYIRAWLFGINAARVNPEIREKLIAYQREVIEVIDRHFSRPLTERDNNEAVMVAMRDNALQQAKLWDMMLAEQRRNRATEEFVEDLDDRVSDHTRAIRDLQQEQARIWARLNDPARLLPARSQVRITPEEKAAIKSLVDDVVAVAQRAGVRLGGGRNDYPAVWEAFKGQFGVAKYDELPAAKYDEAVEWLKAWGDRLKAI